MSEPLATAQELMDALQDAELDPAAAELAVERASGAIRLYTQQTITKATTTDKTFRPAGRLLMLGEIPVDADSVQITDPDGNPIVDIDVHADLGIVRRTDGRRWPSKVTVTYSHGYDDVPEGVRDIALNVATRLVDNPEGVSTKQTPDIGSITYAEGQGRPGLREYEMEQLDQFKTSI